MNKILLTALALLVLTAPAVSQPSNAISKAHLSSVQVLAPHDEQTSFCTGVVVGVTRVLTAEHCVPKNNDGVLVEGKPARVVKKDILLALLDVSEPLQRPILKLAADEPKLGALIIAFGFVDMRGTKLTLQRHVAGANDGYTFVDGPLESGMSGGPAVNEAGELVGINQAANTVAGFLSKVKAIREFLK